MTDFAHDRQAQYRLWDVSRPGLEDNHTDSNFLRDLVINANVTRRQYWEVVWDSQHIAQQMCIAFFVPATFLHLKSGRLGVADLLCLNFGMLAAAGFLLFAASIPRRKETLPPLWRSVRQCFLLLTGIYNMSPLYQKLTLSISSDTIGASTVLLLALHLFLHSYGFKKSTTENFSGALSLGSAIATSVLLSSRLSTAYEVFSYLSFALSLFVLSPFFRKHINSVSPKAHLATTIAILATTMRVVDQHSRATAAALGALVSFTTFACPWLLISVEKRKVQISGPWDEAEVDVAS